MKQQTIILESINCVINGKPATAESTVSGMDGSADGFDSNITPSFDSPKLSDDEENNKKRS